MLLYVLSGISRIFSLFGWVGWGKGHSMHDARREMKEGRYDHG